MATESQVDNFSIHGNSIKEVILLVNKLTIS